MNILCATDNKYVPYCGIMLTSLFENNRDQKICVYVLTGGLKKDNSRSLQELGNSYGHTVKIIEIDNSVFAQCPINPETDHVSIATYYRIAVEKLLPADIDRILYLDCDMIINGPLIELYSAVINGFACGAVIDEAFMEEDPYKRCGIMNDSANPYFNTGMLLINLTYWRENNVMDQCMNFIAANKDRIAFHDQDTLNGVLHKRIRYVGLKYNLPKGLLLKEVFNRVESNIQIEVRNACMAPTIIHYTGAGKPWIKGCHHPFTPIWLRYKNASAWKHIPLIDTKPSLSHRFRTLRNEIIWQLGLKKRPYSYIIPLVTCR